MQTEMTTAIQRTKHEEFVRRITEENGRQNHRPAVLEEDTRSLEKRNVFIRRLAVNAGYNSLLEAAKARCDNAFSQCRQSYDNAVGDVHGASERATQQAYFSGELQKRNIGQQSAALGRSGGASETTLLNMANNYGNARGAIDKNRTSQMDAPASDFSVGRAGDPDLQNIFCPIHCYSPE